MKKDLKYWLDINSHLKQSITFAFLLITFATNIGKVPWLMGQSIGYLAISSIFLLMTFQFILGVRDIVINWSIDDKEMEGKI